LYCHGTGRVELADVAAICGDVTGSSGDDLLHAALGGDLNETSRLFHRLVDARQSPDSPLSISLYSIARLMRWRAEMARGKSAEALIRGARPPIFFKAQDAIIRELKLLNEETLMSASHLLSRASLESRDHPALQGQIAERAFLSLARMA